MKSGLGVMNGEQPLAVTLQSGEERSSATQIARSHAPKVPREMSLAKEIGQCELVERRREEIERLTCVDEFTPKRRRNDDVPDSKRRK